jgi:glycosyltransferase involved in cell wall biosynthesis
LKILYLLNAYVEDGPGILISRISACLNDRDDVEIHTLALSRGGPLEERFRSLNIPTKLIAMKGLFDFPGYKNLKNFIKKGNFDVVHTNILRADLFGRMAANASNVPALISTEHGIHSWEHRGIFVRKLVKAFYFRTMKYTKAVIAVSEFVKNSLKREGVSEDKIFLIHNGVDVEEYTPVPRKEREKLRSYMTDEPVSQAIGLVGNLVEMKGLRYFMQALPLIFKNHPGTLVAVVGDGPLLSEMKKSVKEAGFSHRVKFLGRLNKLTRNVMSALDVLVQPSLTESFGLTAAEALSCQVPVVASNIGGLPELIKDGINGFLVPPKDYSALAEKVNIILDDPDKRIRFGKAGRQHIIENFRIQDTAEKYLALYKQLLGKNL